MQFTAWWPSSCFTTNDDKSDATLFRRPAAVVRHGGGVADGTNFDAQGGESADGAFTAGTGTADANVDRPETTFLRLTAGGDSGLLRGERRALAGAAETERTGAGPGNRIALDIGNRDDGVVEGRLDVNDSSVYDLFLFFLISLLNSYLYL